MNVEAKLGYALQTLKEHVKSQLSNHLADSRSEFDIRGINTDNLGWLITNIHGSIEKSFSTGTPSILSSIKD